MTTPITVQDYVLKQPTGGTGTMSLTYPTAGAYVFLGAGVYTVQITWAGRAQIEIVHQPEGQATQVNVVMGTLPTSPTVTPRVKTLQLSSESKDNRFFLRATGIEDANIRASVIVMRAIT